LFPALKGTLLGPAHVKRFLDEILFKITNTLDKKYLPKAKMESTRSLAIGFLVDAIKDCPENAKVVAECMNSNLSIN